MSTHNETPKPSQMRLYNDENQRLYLNAAERERFIIATNKHEEHIRLFCLTLLYTGCRLSEARELTHQSLKLPAMMGKNFFDAEHPVLVEQEEVSASNFQEGNGPGWYLLDTSRAIKPIIWQEREPYDFTALTKHNDYKVFMNDQYLYGIRARVNAGLGLWQLAYGSKADLNAENYELARSTMMSTKGTDGQTLGVMPTVLVVPPTLEAKARKLLLANQTDGSSNIWHDTAKLIVSFDVA